jgi:hypothetical protein
MELPQGEDRRKEKKREEEKKKEMFVLFWSHADQYGVTDMT